MPPAVSESDSDAASEISVIMPKKKSSKPDPMDEDIQDEDDDDDVEVYVVEQIKSHAMDKGVLVYEVKWQGYDDSDNTWEPEINLDGAVDVLEKYFKKIGGRPTEIKTESKKRGRKSMSSATPEVSSKKPKSETNGSGCGKRRSNLNDTDDWPVTKGGDNWTPPRPLKDAWEDLILKVETIEADDNGTKWAFLLWAQEDKEGKKRTSKALLTSVYIAAPQAMLRFYEQHLVFTDGSGKRSVTTDNVD